MLAIIGLVVAIGSGSDRIRGLFEDGDNAESLALVNLSLGSQVTGSSEYHDQTARNAVDGDTETMWNSGGYPMQWIVVDLRTRSTIHSVRLMTSQLPAGETIHQVVWWEPDNGHTVLHIFDELTSDAQWLEFEPDDPIPGIRYIAIETIASPSWVAWREIEVTGHSD